MSERLGGKPLNFIAQLDLAEIATIAPSLTDPKSGHLSFFYDADGWLDYAGEGDFSRWRVLHLPPGAELRRVEDQVERQQVLQPCAVEISDGWSLPPVRAVIPQDLNFSDAEEDCYFELIDELRGGAGLLLGYADEIQSAIDEEAANMSGDIFRTGKQSLMSIREEQAKRWRLLFQLDSDDELDVMWGDSGMIYYAIRRDDLAAGNFGETMLIFQCC